MHEMRRNKLFARRSTGRSSWRRLSWRALARSDMPRERDAVAVALADAEREGAQLPRALVNGGKLEALIDLLQANDKTKKDLRARLARLDAFPVANLDGARKLAESSAG
jgi:hypothetical protein